MQACTAKGGSAEKQGKEVAAVLLRLPKAAQAAAVQFLHLHVIDNVRQRIAAGHLDFVNEIRVCTLLFFGFPSLQVHSLAFGWRAFALHQMQAAHSPIDGCSPNSLVILSCLLCTTLIIVSHSLRVSWDSLQPVSAFDLHSLRLS